MKNVNYRRRQVESDLSAAIVRSLLNQGKTPKEIGRMLGGHTRAFVSQVKNGQRGLTIAHLEMLEKALKRPIPLILLQTVKETPRTKELERAYKQLHKSVMHLFE